ncbi:MbnP family protein [Sphingobacterium bambusae]|uniref:MbnP family protein n=1 Tax=Sphingobacterium bambusae TaxID=662858 RepID=A0ABW6BFG6_9SPHI|nr:MbnP family protein [Sphingobacterium bambusae]WPL49548.1 MbnP family protein [Sphingobacterium bambusae]
MKNLLNYLGLTLGFLALISCSKSDVPVANSLTLHFNNTFKDETIVLGAASATEATVNTSAKGQQHHFSELRYVISNIRLVKADGVEFPYHVADLDRGAAVIDQSKQATLDFVLRDIPAGEYKQIKFGLGVSQALNTLDQVRFPSFYGIAGANDTQMHWEWGTGYRFTKIEGFYGADNKTLSIHTGSTVEGTKDDPASYVQGVDAYRDVILDLSTHAIVGQSAPRISIKADFDKLLSGKINTITLGDGNATPSVHTAANMVLYVDNLGGNGTNDLTGMFSVSAVTN